MLKPTPHINLVLAPMEGVTDAPMREVLTALGSFDFCVSEFLRISQGLLPDKVFFKHVPELKRGGKTASGCPVLVQLLGGNAPLLADSALQAVELGAPGIDLNFGCPAPTVNRHDGGATLLKYPERIEAIVSAVRAKVPGRFPVSAKLRLGWDCSSAIFENARRAEVGGASWITIHARTKEQGYAPPADWEILADVIRQVKIPVIVNGDLWSVGAVKKAQGLTGASAFMLGRGAVADPLLANRIRGQELGNVDWEESLRKLVKSSEPIGYQPGYFLRRSKQWLSLVAKRGQFPAWETLKRANSMEEVFHIIRPADPISSKMEKGMPIEAKPRGFPLRQGLSPEQLQTTPP